MKRINIEKSKSNSGQSRNFDNTIPLSPNKQEDNTMPSQNESPLSYKGNVKSYCSIVKIIKYILA